MQSKKVREYCRQVVVNSRDNLLISDDVIMEAGEYSKTNFLRGGYEACGELTQKDREREVGDLNHHDKEYIKLMMTDKWNGIGWKKDNSLI